VNTYPMIKDGQLEGTEVLVNMVAAPLSSADLWSENLQPGDIFGVQGVGRVLLAGPQADLKTGDVVVPLLMVDEEGELLDDGAVPGAARTLAVFRQENCARLNLPLNLGLSTGQLSLAKSLGAAYRMVEMYTDNLAEGSSVVVNSSNGMVGQLLVQLLAMLKFKVFAVIRNHLGAQEDLDLACHHLLDLGATKVLFDDDQIRSNIEGAADLPQLAFDGVGGEATARLASSLSKTGDIVCYGTACGSKKRVLPSGWGKKWKGSVIQFSFDEWLHEDIQRNSNRFSEMLTEAATLVQQGRLVLEVREYSIQDSSKALVEMRRPCRTVAASLHFPQLDTGSAKGLAVKPVESQVMKGPPPRKGVTLPPVPVDPAHMDKPARMGWDLDFLDWEKDCEPVAEKCVALEGNLFKPDTVMNELRVMPYTDDALATPVALEIGASKDEASHTLFWLPGAGEVPEEHGPWLGRLAAGHDGLRILVLKPRTGFKWFDLSDGEAVQLGLRFAVLDDLDMNLEGDPAKSSGELSFPPLTLEEVEALQQVEGAALGLARRVVMEEKPTQPVRPNGKLPFFFGGFGQGGSTALFAAMCLMHTPISGVLFTHSGVPVASMLGKRVTQSVKRHTRLCGVYDKADKEVPASFAEALHKMFGLLGCRSSLEWLYEGDGHDFFDDAAARVTALFTQLLEPDVVEQVRSGGLMDKGWRGYMPEDLWGKQQASKVGYDPALEQWRQSVAKRGAAVSQLVGRGLPVPVI